MSSITKRIPVFFGVDIVRIILGYTIKDDTDVLKPYFPLTLMKWYIWLLNMNIHSFKYFWHFKDIYDATALNNDTELLNWLSNEFGVRYVGIHLSLDKAVSSGSIDIVVWMFNNYRKMDQDNCDLGRAWKDVRGGIDYLRIACICNQLDMAKLLFKLFNIKPADMRNLMKITFRDLCLTGLLDIVKWFVKVSEMKEFPESLKPIDSFILDVKNFGHHDVVWLLINHF